MATFSRSVLPHHTPYIAKATRVSQIGIGLEGEARVLKAPAEGFARMSAGIVNSLFAGTLPISVTNGMIS